MKLLIQCGMGVGLCLLLYALYLWYFLHPEWTNPQAFRHLLPFTIPGMTLFNGGYLLLQLVKVRELQRSVKATK